MGDQFNKNKVKKIILDYITEKNDVSHAELEWLFQQNKIPFRGHFDILSNKCDHVVFWSGWSEDIIKVFNELITEGKIHREPTHILTYIVDGVTLPLPLVKKFYPYKTDNWLPTVFCIGPDED